METPRPTPSPQDQFHDAIDGHHRLQADLALMTATLRAANIRAELAAVLGPVSSLDIVGEETVIIVVRRPLTLEDHARLRDLGWRMTWREDHPTTSVVGYTFSRRSPPPESLGNITLSTSDDERDSAARTLRASVRDGRVVEVRVGGVLVGPAPPKTIWDHIIEDS